MDDVEKRTRAVISNYLDVPADKVSEGASFMDDLAMDSLAVMELILAFEEEFSISLKDEAIEAITTVGDAIRVIETSLPSPAYEGNAS